ncbi:MAG: hypothetical protein GF411_00135 [Candidatus Lokiarchaeota archaeon]|nr:hypothetical protein [Candidatus Lokiarchaeota archaeon]
MSQIFIMGPFTKTEGQFKELIGDPLTLLVGDVGLNIKRILFDMFKNINTDIEDFFKDLSSSREEIRKAIKAIRDFFIQVQENDIDVIIEKNYSYILGENLRFAINIIMEFIDIMSLASYEIQTENVEEYTLLFNNLDVDFISFLSISEVDLQNVSEINHEVEIVRLMLQSFVLSFNFSCLFLAVSLVLSLSAKEYNLDSEIIDTIECLIRDWAQSLSAQMDIIGQTSSSSVRFELKGF